MKAKLLVYVLGTILLFSGLTTSIYASTGTLNDIPDGDLPAYFYEEPEEPTLNVTEAYPDVYEPIIPAHITAEAGGPYQNLSGQKIYFRGMAWPGSLDSGYLVSYRWDFGDGASYVGYFPRPIEYKDGKTRYIAVIDTRYPDIGFPCPANHTYPHDGYYTAVLTVYDSKGHSASDYALVAINRPLPDIDFPSWPSSWWTMGESPESSFSKKVRDPQCLNWVEMADYHMGEEIHFKLSFKVPTDKTNVKKIKIVDYLPPTVRYISATPTPSIGKVVYFDMRSISFHPFTVLTWDIGTRPPGSTITITIVGRVERLTYDDFGIGSQYNYIPISYTTKNTAICTYKYTAYSPGCGNPHTRTATLKNTATFRIISGEPHIKIVKQVAIDPTNLWYNDSITVNVGDTVKFKLIVVNDGDVTIPQPIFVKDLLPDGLEYVSGSSSYSLFHGSSITFPMPKEPIINNNLLIWRFDKSLDVDSGIMITFKAVAEKAGTHINLGTVTAHYDCIPLHDEDTAIVIAKKPEMPRIDVEKKVWDGDEWADCISTAVGNNIKFKIIVSNEGNVDLTNIIVNDTLPEFLEYADPTPLPYNNYVEWHIPILKVNETAEIIFNTTSSQVGSGLNKVKATCDQGVEDKDEVCVLVSSYSLDVRKEVSLDNETWDKNVKAYIGDEVYYRIHIKNDGTADLHNITIKDSILWLTFLNFNRSQPEPDYINNGYIYWNISLLKPGEEYYIYYTVDTLSPGEACNLVCGKAEEGVEDSDCSHIKVVPKPVTSVDVEKYVSIDGTNWNNEVSVKKGDMVYFKILVKNNGTTKLDIIEINDTIPDYLEFVENSFIPINADVDGKTVRWTLEDLEVGAIAELYFNTTAISCGEGCNFVEAYATNESNHSYDSDTAGVNVICESNFSLQKLVKWDCHGPYVKDLTITQDQWNQAKWVTFRICVNNTGDTPLDIHVRDDLPEGLIYREGTSTPKPEISGKSLYWNFTDVQPNDKITIEFVADITECGNFTNIVHVTARYDCNEIEKEDYAIVRTPPCTCIPGMKIDKKVWNKETGEWVDSISIGEGPKELRFNITVKNNGTCDIFNLTINDKLGCVLHNLRDFYESDKDLIRKLVDETHGFVSWKLNRTLHPGEKIYMEFNATAYLQQGGSTYNRVDAVGDTSKAHLEANDTVNIYYPIEEPKLAFYPTSIEITDPIYVGDPISKTFEIWNDGTGTLIFNITGYPSYVTVTPKDGTSTDSSDKKTITVEISTSSLGEGEHSVAIPIQSNDGNGIFYVNFTLINPPQLSYTPSTISFYNVEKGNVVTDTIRIWNGGNGTLSYSLTTDCVWVSVDPESGQSTGETDIINVTVDTSYLNPGIHRCNITINSNGGNGTVEVYVEVISPAQPPNVSIEKPIDGAIYLWNKEIFRFFRTIIIGPIVIEVNATDPDGSIEKVEFFIDNTSVYNDTEAPFAYALNDRMFGRHTIKVVAYDDQGLSSEASVEAFIISFGIRTVEIE